MKTITLTQGQVALVDDEDYPPLSLHRWYAQWEPHGKTFYAARHVRELGKKKTITMHRMVMNALPNQTVDHWDHNGLNNRKENLRLCTGTQNQANQKKVRGSSQFKGVCFLKKRNKWLCSIGFKNKTYFIGHFNNEVDAARAYNSAALKLFGGFALINIIPE